MEELGKLLAESLVPELGKSNKCLVISTAEDADFLQAGVKSVLNKNQISTKLAVFGIIIINYHLKIVLLLLFINS